MIWSKVVSYHNALNIHCIKGNKHTMNNITEAAISYVISCLFVSGYLRLNIENRILISSCATKKIKILGPYIFHSYASEILPLSISEKL